MQIEFFWGAVETASVTYRGCFCSLDGDYFPLYTEIKAVWEVKYGTNYIQAIRQLPFFSLGVYLSSYHYLSSQLLFHPACTTSADSSVFPVSGRKGHDHRRQIRDSIA